MILPVPLRPLLLFAVLIGLWQFAADAHPGSLLPGPVAVAVALWELLHHGLLVRYAIASLFRVTWGFALAAVTAIPLGLLLGVSPRAELALGPIARFLRPISPLAWIPLAILWFGVGDLAAIFLIFVACFFPLWIAATIAVDNLPRVYLDAGRNFGLARWALVRRIVLPAVVPQLMTALRVTLGIAWLVVVAAEMIAVNSGLGFLIVDARNAGNRYDLVVAGMVAIGVIGLLLDLGIRRLQAALLAPWSGEATEGATA